MQEHGWLQNLVNEFFVQPLEYPLAQQKSSLLLEILTHDEIISNIKNQTHLMKRMYQNLFTYNNLEILIQLLQQQNKTHTQQMKLIKFDPTGSKVHINYKLPFMAMEILCCECHHINDLLFVGCPENQNPLLQELFKFLDHQPHYLLAGYFSKIINAITKRVSSPTHKYNLIFADFIFGKDQSSLQQKAYLFKSINHLYSLSTIEYLIKWLSFSSQTKEIVVLEDGSKQTTTKNNNYLRVKEKFIEKLIEHINSNILEEEILDNIPALFQEMLNSNSSSAKSKVPSNLILTKSLSNNKTIEKKIMAYDLLAKETHICGILEPHQNIENLSLAKIKSIQVVLNRYLIQLIKFQNERNEDENNLSSGDNLLLSIVSVQQIVELVEWIFENLRKMLNVQDNHSSNSNSRVKQESDKKSEEPTNNKLSTSVSSLILHLLELLHRIHCITSFRMNIIEYYNQHKEILICIIQQLIRTKNNLIQSCVNKLLLKILKHHSDSINPNHVVANPAKNKNNQQKQLIAYQFGIKLFTDVIIPMLEVEGIRQHVIKWAEIILSYENQHVFEDYQEQLLWDHARQIIEQASLIQIGLYKLQPANVDLHYSEKHALFKYSNFLNNYQIQLIYEEKELDSPLKKKKFNTETLQNVTTFQQDVRQVSNQSNKAWIVSQKGQREQKTRQMNRFLIQNQKMSLDWSRSGYLDYDIDSLIEQL